MLPITSSQVSRKITQSVYTVKADDENLTWFFDKAEGSLPKEGEVMFWYGIESGDEVKELMMEFAKHGRDIFGDINLQSRLHKAARAAMSASGGK